MYDDLQKWWHKSLPVIARHRFLLSLRGARFLAYASEQAPQSQWGKEVPRTFLENAEK